MESYVTYRERPSFASRRRLALWGSLLVLYALLGARLVWHHAPRPKAEVPPYLLGRWQTDAPKYQGASFEITDKQLILTTASGAALKFTIAGLDVSEKGDSVATVVYGQQADVEVRFAMAYRAVNGGEVTLRHQPSIVWRRGEGA